MRQLMGEVPSTVARDKPVRDAGDALLASLSARGRSRSHTETVESHLRVHIVPFFGQRSLDRIEEAYIERFLAALRAHGLAPKTARNVLSTLHSAMALAVKRSWIERNPCAEVEAPAADVSSDIRFPTQRELERVLARGVPEDARGSVERPLYLMAAMTGLRQGELLGLRWRDLDWNAQRVRVRQAFVRGEYKSPKSRRGVRGVPLATTVAVELRRLLSSTAFSAEDDLVFAHPETGRPLDRSKVRKRFRAACRRAEVRQVRFHDLRHTFGTRVAASGEVSIRTLQEWMGHRDVKTTLIYADDQPNELEAEIVARPFGGTTGTGLG